MSKRAMFRARSGLIKNDIPLYLYLKAQHLYRYRAPAALNAIQLKVT